MIHLFAATQRPRIAATECPQSDIDGLRAVAVVSVILFHAYPKLAPGGFGVDVFFVISGFLLTSLILNDLNEKRFSTVSFYARRIKRIFPSLALVLASCPCGSTSLLSPLTAMSRMATKMVAEPRLVLAPEQV
jgi:peptidoglycan/LPS O-acetylase OafA/YrhL